MSYPIPNYVKEYAAAHEQLPIAGGWLIRYVNHETMVDRMIYCQTEHALAMGMSESYRRAHSAPAEPV